MGEPIFQLTISDHIPIREGYSLSLFYDEVDVTDRFLEKSTITKSSDGKTLNFSFKDLRLKTNKANDIHVVFVNHLDRASHASYLQPFCSLYEKNKLVTMLDFEEAQKYLTMIRQVASEADYNPSFLAGIVAQESGFNPNAISWAKAIGLTQITSLAEKDVYQKVKTWPRYPGISHMPYLKIKAKVMLGEINHKKEWRLNPKKSIQGGAAYIDYLENYWALELNKELLMTLQGDFEQNLSKVILASYNSGAFRVKTAMKKMGDDWMKHPKLKEAAKYVRKVSSYCYHYTQREVINVNET